MGEDFFGYRWQQPVLINHRSWAEVNPQLTPSFSLDASLFLLVHFPMFVGKIPLLLVTSSCLLDAKLIGCKAYFFVGETTIFLLLKSQVGLGTSPSRLFPIEQCSKLILIWAYTIHIYPLYWELYKGLRDIDCGVIPIVAWFSYDYGPIYSFGVVILLSNKSLSIICWHHMKIPIKWILT